MWDIFINVNAHVDFILSSKDIFPQFEEKQTIFGEKV